MATFELIQRVDQCECLTPPGCGCMIKANEYYIKKGGDDKGSIKEESSKCCTCCCTPGFRTYVSTITDDEGKVHTAHKEFRCGYLCSMCCSMRPDIIVKDGSGTAVGYVELPCCPALTMKM